MSAKKKQTSNKWQSYIVENIKYKILSESFEGLKNIDFKLARFKVHGIIYGDDELSANILEDTSVECSDRIHMHPLTMQEMKLTIYTPVYLSLSIQNRLYAHCFAIIVPDKSVNLSTVKISDRGLQSRLASERGLQSRPVSESGLQSLSASESGLQLRPVLVKGLQSQLVGSLNKILESQLVNSAVLESPDWFSFSQKQKQQISLVAKSILADKYICPTTPININFFSHHLKISICQFAFNESKFIIQNEDKEQSDSANLSVRIFKTTKDIRLTWKENGSIEKNIIFAGFEKEKKYLRTLIENSLSSGGKMTSVLITGQHGSGKQTLVQHVCRHFIRIKSTDILIRYYQYKEISNWINSLIENESNPIIYFQNVENILPQSDTNDRNISSISSLFLTAIDKISETGKCKMIVASCSAVSQLNSQVQTSNLFQHRIHLLPPTSPDRFLILKELLKKNEPNLNDDDIKSVSTNCHAFTPLLLAKVLQLGINKSGAEAVDKQHLLSAMCEIQNGNVVNASAIKVDKISWNDIAGQAELKQKIQKLVEWPLKFAQKYERLGLRPAKGILLYGPPGCSKTMVAKAVANECGLNFFSVKVSELISKYIGESEKNVRALFSQARLATPSVIFFDEVESFCSNRDRNSATNNILTTVLTEMDGVKELKGVFVMAATNQPHIIDQALLRPGRLCKSVYVPLPDRDTRRQILEAEAKKFKFECDVEVLAEEMDGYSCSEIVNICRKASKVSLTESISTFLRENKSSDSEINFDLLCPYLVLSELTIRTIMKEQKPLVTQAMIDTYEQFARGEIQCFL